MCIYDAVLGSVKNREQVISKVGNWAAMEGLQIRNTLQISVGLLVDHVSSWPLRESSLCSAKWANSYFPCGAVVRIK